MYKAWDSKNFCSFKWVNKHEIKKKSTYQKICLQYKSMNTGDICRNRKATFKANEYIIRKKTKTYFSCRYLSNKHVHNVKELKSERHHDI